MSKVKPVPVSHHNLNRAFLFKDILDCSFVHLESAVRKSKLDQPYEGLYKVIKRLNDRNYVIKIRGKRKVVNVERLIPAHIAAGDLLNEDSSRAADSPVKGESFGDAREFFDPPVSVLRFGVETTINQHGGSVLEEYVPSFDNKIEILLERISRRTLIKSNDKVGSNVSESQTARNGFTIARNAKFVPDILKSREKKMMDLE